MVENILDRLDRIVKKYKNYSQKIDEIKKIL